MSSLTKGPYYDPEKAKKWLDSALEGGFPEAEAALKSMDYLK